MRNYGGYAPTRHGPTIPAEISRRVQVEKRGAGKYPRYAVMLDGEQVGIEWLTPDVAHDKADRIRRNLALDAGGRPPVS